MAYHLRHGSCMLYFTVTVLWISLLKMTSDQSKWYFCSHATRLWILWHGLLHLLRLLVPYDMIFAFLNDLCCKIDIYRNEVWMQNDVFRSNGLDHKRWQDLTRSCWWRLLRAGQKLGQLLKSLGRQPSLPQLLQSHIFCVFWMWPYALFHAPKQSCTSVHKHFFAAPVGLPHWM